MRVVSLFDGIAGAKQAIGDCFYYAFEIDKYAITIAKKNHPGIMQCGNVIGADFTKYKDIDLLIGGSPCQGFSFAGNQANFKDPRSKLFFEFLRALTEIKPKYFLLENVKMKKEYQDFISKLLGVEPILINSALVTAQNRKRLYWTNIPNVGQPEDAGILLKDIIEDGNVDRFKSYCLDANYYKGTNLKQYFTKSRRQVVFKQKSQTILSTIYKENAKSRLKRKKLGLCVQAGEALIKGHDSVKHVYSTEGKSPTLTTMGGGHREPKIITDAKHWRKLTPLECERLQGFPDEYTKGVSNTQRYKALGNSFTVPVIKHILKGVINANNNR